MTRFAENKGKDTKDFLHTFVRYKYTVSVSIVSLKKFSKNMQDVLDSIYEHEHYGLSVSGEFSHS